MFYKGQALCDSCQNQTFSPSFRTGSDPCLVTGNQWEVSFWHFGKLQLVRFSVCGYTTSQYPHKCHVVIAVLKLNLLFFGLSTKKTHPHIIALSSTRKYFHNYVHGELTALVHIGGAWGAPFFCYYGNATPAHQQGCGTEVPNCKLSLCVCVSVLYACVCMCVVTIQI